MSYRLLRWMGRRWWAFALAALWVVTLGIAAGSQVPPLYRASRQVLFTVSPTYQDPDIKVNPFLNFVPNLTTALEVVSISVTSPEVAKDVAPPGSGVTYGAGQSPFTGAPVMLIQVEAPTTIQADRAADKLVLMSSEILSSQQESAGAPQRTWVSDTLISSTAEPERVWSKQIRMGVAAAAVAALMALALIALLLRRDILRARPPEHQDPGPTTTAAGFTAGASPEDDAGERVPRIDHRSSTTDRSGDESADQEPAVHALQH